MFTTIEGVLSFEYGHSRQFLIMQIEGSLQFLYLQCKIKAVISQKSKIAQRWCWKWRMEEGCWSGPNVVCSNSFLLLISEIQDANCFYYLFWNQPKRLYLPQTIHYFGFTTLSIAVTKTFHRGVVCPLNLKLRYALLSWFECRKYSGNALDLLNLLCNWPRK